MTARHITVSLTRKSMLLRGLLLVASAVLLFLTIADAAPGDDSADFVIGQPDLVTASCGSGNAGLCLPVGLAFDTSGNLYVADYLNSRVLEYDQPLQTDFLADRVFGQPDFATTGCNSSGLNAASLCSPGGLDIDIWGNLYVADYMNNRVLRYNNALTDQVADQVFGQPDFASSTCNNGGRSASSMCRPAGVDAQQTGAFPNQSVLFVADASDGVTDNSRVLVFDNPVSGNTVADWVLGQPDFSTGGCNSGGLGASSICRPIVVMAVASASSVFVADTENNRVLRYDFPLSVDGVADNVYGQPNFTTNTCNTGGISATSLCRPSSVWVSLSQDRMLVAEQTNNRVFSFYSPLSDAAADRVFGQGGSFTSGACNLGGLSAQSLCNPNGVSMDSAGNMYVSDSNNTRVVVYDRPFDPDSDGLPSEIDNCPALANPGQENGDGDSVGDACDNCPAVSNSAQTDGDADTVGNACDNCPTVSNVGQDNQDLDEYGDACEAPQCVEVVNHWVVPSGDDDCDGFTTTRETFMVTDANVKCAATAGANNEALPDRWPVDFNDDQKATILDVSTFSPIFGSMPPGPPYNVRHDFNADNKITILDVAQYSAFFGKSCSP